MSAPKKISKPAKPTAPRGRPADPSREETDVVSLRLPSDLLSQYEARASALNASGEFPAKVTRASLILHVLRQAAAGWDKA